jgi:hypothetical protein
VTARLISSIRIEKLFGLYTYNIPAKEELSNSAILYGDNGVGKSTILRLVFHLLSAGDNRGHRTALYNAEFLKLDVLLTSGVRLTATWKGDGPSRILVLEIEKNEQKIAIWEYMPRRSNTIDAGSIHLEVDSSVSARIRHLKTKPERVDFPHRGETAYLAPLGAPSEQVDRKATRSGPAEIDSIARM